MLGRGGADGEDKVLTRLGGVFGEVEEIARLVVEAIGVGVLDCWGGLLAAELR